MAPGLNKRVVLLPSAQALPDGAGGGKVFGQVLPSRAAAGHPKHGFEAGALVRWFLSSFLGGGPFGEVRIDMLPLFVGEFFADLIVALFHSHSLRGAMDKSM